MDSPAGTNQIQESYWKAGQYEMRKPCSEGLRERVIGAAQDGATIPEIAERLGVSISSVVASAGSAAKRIWPPRR